LTPSMKNPLSTVGFRFVDWSLFRGTDSDGGD
jgi:hypothetical protein